MHVLQLLPALGVGGVERGVVDLAKGLVARGHRVTVVSSGGPLVARLVAAGAAHHELPVHEKSPRAFWTCVPAVSALIASGGVDLVHARSRVPAWIGLWAARRTQRPFLTTAHGFYRPHPASRVMGWGRLVIVPSAALGAYLTQRFGVPKERLRVVPRGVDLDEFTLRPPRPTTEGLWSLGLFGRVSPLKGHAVALRACAELRRRGLAVRLLIAGDAPGAPVRQPLQALARSLRIADAVEWLGPREDMPDVIASVDAVLVPSVYPESFGRSVIEAQAVGRPVIASRLGALAELIEDGTSGLLVPPEDPHALAQAAARLLQDEALRRRCIAEGRRRVEAEWSASAMVERTLAVYEECLTRPRVLVWKLSALGDVVLSTPSLRAIRRHYPKAHITLAVGRRAYEAVARCPHVDEILIYDGQRKDRGLRGRARLLRRLQRAAFDVSIDLQNSRFTHLMSWLGGVPVRIGYRRRWGRLLNRGVRLPRVVLAPIAHQHYLLQQAGIAPAGEALEVWPSPLDEAAAERLLPKHRPHAAHRLVGLHPGGSGRWRTKRWALSRWAQLCDRLAQHHVTVVVTGGREERALGRALARLTASPPHDVIGQTSVLELACLLRRCGAFVTHDSAPLHLAAAVGTPTIALFGPTDPARHVPPTFRGQVIKKDVFCSPCYSPRCRTITHACMDRIGVDEVLAAVLALLADAEAAPAGRREANCASS
jgi:lipopolysaccharide heptosyltransferase II